MSNEKISKLEYYKITQEKINGSDQLLTVIPYPTNDKTKNERILLLKIEKEIISVVFSMHHEEDSQKDHFSGKIIIRNLNGDFLNGFRIKNREYISQFVKKQNSLKNNATYRGDGDIDGGELSEVIIIKSLYDTMEIPVIFDRGGASYDFQMMSWNNGGGGNCSGVGTAITSLADLKTKIANNSPDSFETNFVQQQNQVLASTKFNLLPWTGIKVIITQNIGNQFTIQNVASNSWG